MLKTISKIHGFIKRIIGWFTLKRYLGICVILLLISLLVGFIDMQRVRSEIERRNIESQKIQELMEKELNQKLEPKRQEYLIGFEQSI